MVEIESIGHFKQKKKMFNYNFLTMMPKYKPTIHTLYVKDHTSCRDNVLGALSEVTY